MAGTCYAWGTIGGSFPWTQAGGALGLGNTNTATTRPTPVLMPAGVQVVMVDSNGTGINAGPPSGDSVATLFLGSDGQVYFAGSNLGGRRGNGTTDTIEHSTPELVAGLSNIVKVSIGSGAFALDASGNLYGWGYNGDGTLGLGDQATHLTPVLVATGVRDVSAGRGQTAIQLTNGQVLTCGVYGRGALGQGPLASSFVTTFQGIVGGDTVAKVACGRNQIVYVLSDGTVKASGDGFPHTPNNAPLGPTIFSLIPSALTGDGANTPTIVDSMTSIVDAVVDDSESWYLDSAGIVYMYGEIGPGDGAGNTGQYSVGQSVGSFITVQNPPGVRMVALGHGGGGNGVPSAPRGSGAAIGSDGKLYTWGDGTFLIPGSGADPTTNASPVSLNGLTNVAYVLKRALFMFAISGQSHRGRSFAQIIG